MVSYPNVFFFKPGVLATAFFAACERLLLATSALKFSSSVVESFRYVFLGGNCRGGRFWGEKTQGFLEKERENEKETPPSCFLLIFSGPY